jgi:hypothetical protein
MTVKANCFTAKHLSTQTCFQQSHRIIWNTDTCLLSGSQSANPFQFLSAKLVPLTGVLAFVRGLRDRFRGRAPARITVRDSLLYREDARFPVTGCILQDGASAALEELLAAGAVKPEIPGWNTIADGSTVGVPAASGRDWY